MICGVLCNIPYSEGSLLQLAWDIKFYCVGVCVCVCVYACACMYATNQKVRRLSGLTVGMPLTFLSLVGSSQSIYTETSRVLHNVGEKWNQTMLLNIFYFYGNYIFVTVIRSRVCQGGELLCMSPSLRCWPAHCTCFLHCLDWSSDGHIVFHSPGLLPCYKLTCDESTALHSEWHSSTLSVMEAGWLVCVCVTQMFSDAFFWCLLLKYFPVSKVCLCLLYMFVRWAVLISQRHKA